MPARDAQILNPDTQHMIAQMNATNNLLGAQLDATLTGTLNVGHPPPAFAFTPAGLHPHGHAICATASVGTPLKGVMPLWVGRHASLVVQ